MEIKVKRIIRRIVYALAIPGLLSMPLFLSGCGKKTELANAPIKKVNVSAVNTAYSSVGKYINAPGSAYSVNNTAISAHIMGYVVYENVRLGDAVNKGQLLLKLSAPEINSKYLAAKAGYADAKKTFDRIKTLYMENSVSKQMYDNTLMQYKVARANLNEAASYVNYKNIYSPIDGVVTQKQVSVGDLVGPGRMLLMIESTGNLEFKTSVNVKYFNKIKSGETVRLKFSAIKSSFDGKVVSVVRSANPYSHSVMVRIALSGEAKSGLLPGMYGIAFFKLGKTNAIIIPKKAVFKQLGINGVYVAGKSGEVMFQPVKKGFTYKKGYVTVLNGLNPGMTVITGGLRKITAGSFVNPEFNK